MTTSDTERGSRCPQCSAELEYKSKFCPHCGTKLTDSEAEEVESSSSQIDSESTKLSVGSRYTILDKLGRGGMANVYRAYDQMLDTTVALKRLHKRAIKDQKGLERFLVEARAIVKLNHPNIIRVYNVDRDDKGYFISMEYVDGDDMRNIVKHGGAMPMARALKIIRAVCEGLAHAHERGIVHRDLKPGNILLTHDDVPKIVDFGFAQIGAKEELTESGYTVGTMVYMAPEQKFDPVNIDHRADIFSLGLCMYELLVGRPPVRVDLEKVPEEARDLVAKALEMDPADRYQNAREVMEAIDAFLGEPVAEPSGGGPVACLKCNYRNPADAKYCESCGGKLVEACPKCGTENHIRSKYCGGCGLDLRAFIRMLGLLREGKEAFDKHQYTTASSAFQRALELVPDYHEATRLLNLAQEHSQWFEEFRSKAQKMLDEYNYEEAKVYIERALELKPDDPNLSEVLDVLPEKIKERDLAFAIRDARMAWKDQDYRTVARASRKALDMEPDNEEMRKAYNFASSRAKNLNKQDATAKLLASKMAMEKGRYKDALELAEEGLQYEAKNEDLLQIAASAKEHLNSIRTGRIDKELETVRELISGGDFKAASMELARLKEAFGNEPEINALDAQVRAKLAVRTMIRIPGGEFIYGDVKHGLLKRGEKINLPAFYIDKYPVTNREYMAFVDGTGHRAPGHWVDGKIPQGLERHPVTNVSYQDAEAYAKWVGKRLPTEYEWERAARGTDARKYPWGDSFDPKRCNAVPGHTSPVNKHLRGVSPSGAMDMMGNVWEWCEDRYASGSGTAMLRGGPSRKVTLTTRKSANIHQVQKTFGFRCAKDAPEEPKKG